MASREALAHKRASSLAQLVAQERLRHLSLPPPLPATCGQTKSLLQSGIADKRSQKLRLVTLMPPATEQQTKRKRDCQAAKNSTGNKKLRFLNMNPKQVRRRYKTMKRRLSTGASRGAPVDNEFFLDMTTTVRTPMMTTMMVMMTMMTMMMMMMMMDPYPF